MPNIIFGITSSIALYKTLDVISLLTKEGFNIIPIPTFSAQKLISKELFEYISGNRVPIDSYQYPHESKDVGITHIEVAKKGDLFVIAPATANIIANMAHGLANSILMDTILAYKGKILVFPAMNTTMWENKATQHNVQTLRERGIDVVNPDCGLLACKDIGIGKLKPVSEIVDRIKKEFVYNEKNSLKILITMGSSIEPIDPVRVITNLSSGKMGASLAREWVKRGASVTVIYGSITENLPEGLINKISFTYNEDLETILNEELSKTHFDICIMAAAPCDFELIQKNNHKMKKQDTITLELRKKRDILKNLKNPHQTIIVGFAAETENLFDNAHKKLKEKNLNMIIANTAYSAKKSVGIGKDDTEYAILDDKGYNEYMLITENKQKAATSIVEAILQYKEKKI